MHISQHINHKSLNDLLLRKDFKQQMEYREKEDYHPKLLLQNLLFPLFHRYKESHNQQRNYKQLLLL
jgi:hypothetical protein